MDWSVEGALFVGDLRRRDLLRGSYLLKKYLLTYLSTYLCTWQDEIGVHV